MQSKISNISELPDWYRNCNYAEQGDFSRIEWFIHFRRRYRTRMLLALQSRNLVRNLDKRIIEKISRELEVALREIRSDPVQRISADQYESVYIPSLYLDGPDAGPRIRPAVYGVTLSELAVATSWLIRKYSDGIRHAPLASDDERFFLRDGTHGTPYWLDDDTWLHRPIDDLIRESYEDAEIDDNDRPDFKHLISIDLRQSDKSILESFNWYLAKARSVVEPLDQVEGTRIRIDGESKWARYNILGYLDLQQWAVEASVDVPARVIADALSETSNDAIGEENVRKTIRPAAEMAMAYQTQLQIESWVSISLTQ